MAKGATGLHFCKAAWEAKALHNNPGHGDVKNCIGNGLSDNGL